MNGKSRVIRRWVLGSRLVLSAGSFVIVASTNTVILASLLSEISGSALAYDLLGWDWSYQGNPVESHFVICENNAPVGASKRIQAAAAKWNYANLKFTFDADDCPSGIPLNYVDFGTLDDPSKTGEASTPNVSGTTQMKRCTIRFNMAKNWYLGSGDPDPDENDLFSAALHEFGHCVGLGDVDTPGVVMQRKLDQGKKLRDLNADDLAGRNKIYGAP